MYLEGFYRNCHWILIMLLVHLTKPEDWEWLAQLKYINTSQIVQTLSKYLGFPGGSNGKGSCLQCRRPGFDSWVGNIPWRREWLPTPVFLPGEFHGQRNLVGHSPWGCKELKTAERLSMHTHQSTWLAKLVLQSLWSLRVVSQVGIIFSKRALSTEEAAVCL